MKIDVYIRIIMNIKRKYNILQSLMNRWKRKQKGKIRE